MQLLSEEIFDFSRGEMTQQKIKELKSSLNRLGLLSISIFSWLPWRFCLIVYSWISFLTKKMLLPVLYALGRNTSVLSFNLYLISYFLCSVNSGSFMSYVCMSYLQRKGQSSSVLHWRHSMLSYHGSPLDSSSSHHWYVDDWFFWVTECQLCLQKCWALPFLFLFFLFSWRHYWSSSLWLLIGILHFNAWQR